MVETYYQKGLRSLILWGIVTAGFVLLVSRMSFFPYPEMLTEKYFLRIGMLPYTQINDQHFPGIFLLPIGDSVNELRVWQLGIVLINAALVYLLTKNRLATFTYLVFWLIWEGNTLWIDSFVSVLVLAGFAYLYKGWTFKHPLNFFVTGLLFGLVLLFKQHGIVLCLVAGLWVILQRPKLRNLLIFILAVALPLGLAMLALYNLGVWDEFWFWTITHNLQGYVALEGRPPRIGELLRFLILFIPAWVVLLWRSDRPKIFFWGGMLLATSVFMFPRFGLIHGQIILPLLIILISKVKWLNWILLLVASIFLARVILKDNLGRVYFYDQSAQITVDYVRSHYNPSKPIYVYGVNDNIYHLTHSYPPQKTWIELLRGNIIAGVENTIIKTLVNDPPQFILIDPQASIDNQKISEFTPLVNNYILSYYSKRHVLSNGIEVWYAK